MSSAGNCQWVSFTHLDQELFDGSGATKWDLIDYLDAVTLASFPA